MRTHNVQEGDYVALDNDHGFVHCGAPTVAAFAARQPLPYPQTTVVGPSMQPRTEHLTVGPDDVVCVVSPHATVYVKGEPQKRGSSFTAVQLIERWETVKDTDPVKAELRINWPRLTRLLDELTASFR